MSPTQAPGAAHLRASVIVRARDEQASIGRCLDALAAQRGVAQGQLEVIVVDSGSRDRTTEIAARAGARILELPSRDFTYGGALNLGAAHAGAAVLVALSAHAFAPDRNWLQRLLAPFADPRVACACGDRYAPEGEPLLGRIEQDQALARRRPEWGFSNAAGAFRAELWSQRPFRTDLPACEDKEWALHWLAHGYVCVVDRALAVEHDHTHDRLSDIYRRARREAAVLAELHGLPPQTPGQLVRKWWQDTRWYDSRSRARLSPWRTARMLGAHAGRRQADPSRARSH